MNNGKKKFNLLLTGNLLALSAALCWGLNEPANKMIIPQWMSASGVALSRLFGAAILTWLASCFVRTEKIERGDRKLLWFAALLMLGFVYVFSLAFNTASPIDISIILTFQPMMVVAIHVLFKHEKVNRLELVGMGIAFAGAVLVILGGGNLSGGRLIGDIFALVCAISYSAYLVVIEGPSKKYRPINLMRWVFLFAAILSLPFIFTVKNVTMLTHPTLTPILALGFIILFPTFYCYLVTPPAIKQIGSELVSVYQYLVPVIATIASLLLKIDSFHWYQPVSFVIIIAGVLITNYAKDKKQPAPQK